MDLKNLPNHGGILVFGKSRLKTQNLGNAVQSDGISTPNFFWLKTQKISYISAGDQHALFASDNGRCYGFGLNDWGQLALEKESKNEISKPALIKQLKNIPIMELGCGRSHSVLLTGNSAASGSKQIYAFGSNTDSQLGIPNSSASATPMTVHTKSGSIFPSTVIKVVCGSDFSLALTNDGIVYGWGDNDVGQLGDVAFKQEVTQPTRIKLSSNTTKSTLKKLGTISDIAAGYHMAALISSTGMVLVAGENYAKQFRPLTTPEPAKSVKICGNGQILLLSSSGNLYFSIEIEDEPETDPENYFYENTQFLPLTVPLQNDEFITTIDCGFQHSAITTNHGNLFTFGEGSAQGQLCHGNTTPCQRPTLVTKYGKELFFENVACGGSFTVTSVRRREAAESFDPSAGAVVTAAAVATPVEDASVPAEPKPGFWARLFGKKKRPVDQTEQVANTAPPQDSAEVGPDGEPLPKKSRMCTVL